MEYEGQSQLLETLEDSLVSLWLNSEVLDSNQVATIKGLAAFSDFSGVTVIYPTRGKLQALGGAIKKFVEATLEWHAELVSGMMPDLTLVQEAASEKRSLWISLPLSPCAVGRIWTVCDANKSQVKDSNVQMHAIVPEDLAETFLKERVLTKLRHDYQPVLELSSVVSSSDHASGGGQDPCAKEAVSYFETTFGQLGNELLSGIEQSLRISAARDSVIQL